MSLPSPGNRIRHGRRIYLSDKKDDSKTEGYQSGGIKNLETYSGGELVRPKNHKKKKKKKKKGKADSLDI